MNALLYALCAFAAAACLRAVAPVSRSAALVLALLPLCLTGRALLTGGVYAPIDISYAHEPLASIADEAGVTRVMNPATSDVFAQFLPWHAAMRDSVRNGQWPLWNRFDYGGQPLAGSAQVAAFHPVTMLGLLLPAPQEPAFAASMLYLIAALGMCGLLRAFNLGEVASLFGAAAWMLSTYLVFFAGTAHGLALATLPFVLLGAMRVAREPGLRSTAMLVVALLLLLFSGHPETTLHVVALAVAFFFFEFAARPSRSAILSGLAAGALSLFLGAIFLLPVADVLAQTGELTDRRAYVATSAGGEELIHRLRVNVLPLLEGEHGELATHDRHAIHGWFSTAYAGSLLFAPAVYALRFARGRRRWFFAGLLLFGLAVGVKAPLVTDVLERLPGFSISLNERMLSFAALALAVLAAMGIQRWIESPRDAMPLLFLATAAVVVIAIIAAGPAIEAASLSKSFVRMHLTRMLLPLLLAAAVAFAVRSRRYVALALLGLLLVQRIGETATLQPTLPARAWFPHIAALDELARSNDVFRIVGVGEMLPPNMATHYGLEDARGYEATNNRRVAATMPLWSKRQLVWSNRVDDLNAPMLRMLNVRYALAPAHSTPPEGWTQHASGRGFEVFENSRPMPRAFIPRVIHFAPAERVLAAMSACGDFGAEGWIESDESKTEVNGSGRIDVERRGGALRLHASIDSPAWVIVSQNGWRGWRALEDEQPLTVRVGNHAFLAFHLTAGEHDIALSYLPHAFVLGRAITASTTLAVMLAYAIALLARRRDEEEEDEIELLPVSAA